MIESILRSRIIAIISSSGSGVVEGVADGAEGWGVEVGSLVQLLAAETSGRSARRVDAAIFILAQVVG